MPRRVFVPLLAFSLAALALAGLWAGLRPASAGGTVLHLPFLARNYPLETIFGVEVSAVNASQGLDLFPSQTFSPTTWVRRAALSWRLAEPTPGVYNWSAAGLEAEIAEAARRDLKLILVVREAPDWAAPRPCGPVNADKYQAMASFVAAAAQRYPTVKYWEMWNEPDVDFAKFPDPNSLWGCWGDSTDPYYGGGRYADMLKAVYPALKQANPAAYLVGGALLLNCDPGDPQGVDCSPGKYLEGILREGGGAALDGISFHAYDYFDYASNLPGRYASAFNSRSNFLNDGPVVISKARFVKNLLAQYGVTGKFLMNTESAILSNECNSVCESTKADYVAQVYAAALAEGLRANIWYSVLGWSDRNTALLDGSLQPLPAYQAYQTAAGLLSTATYQSTITEVEGLKGYRFARAGRGLWIAWSPDRTVRNLTLPAAPVRVLDVLGQPQTVSGAVVPVGVSPLWIELP